MAAVAALAFGAWQLAGDEDGLVPELPASMGNANIPRLADVMLNRARVPVPPPASVTPSSPAVAELAKASHDAIAANAGEDSARIASEKEARVQTALRLAARSPDGALRWTMAEPRELAGPAIIAASLEAARACPAEALRALAELPSSPERDDALVHTAAQWGALDPRSATSWASGLPASEVRERACTAMATAMADRDPRAAADFVATQMAEGHHLRIAAVSVAQRWAQQDATAAREWVEQFPSDSLRENALHEIAIQQSAASGTPSASAPTSF